MKAVRFHEDVRCRTGETPLRAKRKGRRKGQKLALNVAALDATRAASAYEVIKNEDLHNSIVAVCKGINAKSHVLHLLNGLLLVHSDDQTAVTDVETGLARLASRLKSGPPLPRFTDLDTVKAKQYLFALAGNDRFAALLKTPSEISSKYSLYTVELDFDVEDEETVTRLMLRAAFKEWQRLGRTADDFEEACTTVFNSGSKYYESALKKATEGAKKATEGAKKPGNNDDGTISIEDWIEKVLELVDEGNQVLNQVQANSDSESEGSKSQFDAIRNAALTALVKWAEIIDCDETLAVVFSNAIIRVHDG